MDGPGADPADAMSQNWAVALVMTWVLSMLVAALLIILWWATTIEVDRLRELVDQHEGMLVPGGPEPVAVVDEPVRTDTVEAAVVTAQAAEEILRVGRHRAPSGGRGSSLSGG